MAGLSEVLVANPEDEPELCSRADSGQTQPRGLRSPAASSTRFSVTIAGVILCDLLTGGDGQCRRPPGTPIPTTPGIRSSAPNDER